MGLGWLLSPEINQSIDQHEHRYAPSAPPIIAGGQQLLSNEHIILSKSLYTVLALLVFGLLLFINNQQLKAALRGSAAAGTSIDDRSDTNAADISIVQKNDFSAHSNHLRYQAGASEPAIAAEAEERGATSLAAAVDTSDNARGFKEVQVQPPPTRLKYTSELASRAVEPTVWTCGRNDRHNQTVLDPITNQRPCFAFVHVFKTAGSTIRYFFREYAKICEKSLAIVQQCQGYVDVEQCKLKFGVNTTQQHESVNDAILHDHYDILGGHFSFGMADHIFSNATVTTTTTATSPQNRNGAAPQEVRHMVFLRQPMTRYVSGVLYLQNHQRETVQGVAEYIKKKIRSSREKGEYVSSIYKYLLTPTQRAMLKYDLEQTQEAVVAHKEAQLSIDNLVRYNAVVGMTETFSESMQIFEHVLGHIGTSAKKEEEVKGLFSRYIGREVSRNVSKKNSIGISAGSVLEELNKDDEFMVVFREFVKYEQMIVDFAMDMHHKQYDAVLTTSLH